MEKLESKDVVFVNLDDDLQSVLGCFKANKISHVPVLTEKKVVGMVSKTDVVEFLYEAIEKRSGEAYLSLLQSVKVRELMIQPIIVAKVEDSQMTILEKLLDHEVGSVVLKKENDILGIVTERDMIRMLAKEVEGSLTFTEKMGMHLVQWLDRNGLIRISRMLSEIGI